MQYISNATFAGEVNEAVTYKLCSIKNNPNQFFFLTNNTYFALFNNHGSIELIPEELTL